MGVRSTGRTEAVRLAEIQSRDKLAHEVVTVLTDPLWSSVLGFVAVHELRRANLVGPVADDLLYGGIIAINSNRAGLIREARSAAEGITKGISGSVSALAPLLAMV